MGKETKEIEWKKRAYESIANISIYIAGKGYPENAKKFTNRLYEFGESLLIFPEKYAICRFPKLAKRSLRCAVFEKNYMFINKVIRNRLIIYNVLNCSTIK